MKKNVIAICAVVLLPFVASAQFSLNVGYLHQTSHTSEPIYNYAPDNIGTWALYAEVDYNYRLPYNLGVSLGARISSTTSMDLSEFLKKGYAVYKETNYCVPLRLSYTFSGFLLGWDLSPFVGVLAQYTGSAFYEEDATPLHINYCDETCTHAIKKFTMMPTVGFGVAKAHWQVNVEYAPVSLNRSLHGNYTHWQSGLTIGVGYRF